MEEKERKLPYRILGVYKPTVLNPDNISRDLADLLKHAGFYNFEINSIRSPSWHNPYAEGRRAWNNGGDAEWHKDGTSFEGLILWSTKSPTQIKLKDSDEIFTPDPYQVILVRNNDVLHRRHGDMKDRWFARILVETLKPGDLDNAR